MTQAAFVYFATELVDCDDRVATALREALSASGHLNGPAHSELMVSKRVVVVEINARFHNAKVSPLVRECCGVSTIAAAADACLLDSTNWERLPSQPTLRKAGKLVHLVCAVSGVLQHLDETALNTLDALETKLALEIYENFATPGAPLKPTIDIKTDAGFVLLCGDHDKVQADYDAIQQLQPNLFQI